MHKVPNDFFLVFVNHAGRHACIYEVGSLAAFQCTPMGGRYQGDGFDALRSYTLDKIRSFYFE